MSRPVVCPHCGEELDIPSELRGREVRCAACRNIFSAAADAPPPPRATRRGQDEPGRSPTDRSYNDDDPWDDPPRRQRRKSGLGWLWLLLGGGGFLACLGCCGCGAILFQMDNPEFVTHESPRGRFAAEFPGVPLEAQRVGDDGLTRECTEASREFPQETYFVHYRDLPAAPIGDDARQSVLRDACTRFLAQTPGTQEKSRTPTAVGTHPAVDLFMTHPDDTATHVRIVLAGRRLYAVGLTGELLQPASKRLKHFLGSFRVTSDEERKK